jgi:heat shock protein HslJ
MLKNIAGIFICIILTLLLGSAGCTSTPPPTCTPVGYTYSYYHSPAIPWPGGLILSQVIWGSYKIRFLGCFDSAEGTPLQTLLLKNGQPVDWWPEYLFFQVHDQVHNDTWAISLNANEYNTPAEFPKPESGYSLEIFTSNYPQTSVKFQLDFSGPPPESTLTDNLTTPELDGSQWILSSINGHAPLPFIHVTLCFNKDSFHGSGGCNLYGGRYQTKAPNLLNISQLVMTEMGYWWRSVNTQEEALVNALYDVVCYRIVDDRLELYDISTGGRSLVFKRQK